MFLVFLVFVSKLYGIFGLASGEVLTKLTKSVYQYLYLNINKKIKTVAPELRRQRLKYEENGEYLVAIPLANCIFCYYIFIPYLHDA